jgi:hypothetical protein
MTNLQSCQQFGKVYDSEAQCITGGNGSGTVQWCNWTWGSGVECYPIDDTGLSIGLISNLQACQAYGKVYADEAACIAGGDGNNDGTLLWCNWAWGSAVECHPITNPNGQNPENRGLTNLQTCQQFGKVYADEAYCIAGGDGKTM